MFLVADIEQVDMADTQLIILFHCLFAALLTGELFPQRRGETMIVLMSDVKCETR